MQTDTLACFLSQILIKRLLCCVYPTNNIHRPNKQKKVEALVEHLPLFELSADTLAFDGKLPFVKPELMHRLTGTAQDSLENKILGSQAGHQTLLLPFYNYHS